jgi:hypothetical protein
MLTAAREARTAQATGGARMQGPGRQARWFPNRPAGDQPGTGFDPDDSAKEPKRAKV